MSAKRVAKKTVPQRGEGGEGGGCEGFGPGWNFVWGRLEAACQRGDVKTWS